MQCSGGVFNAVQLNLHTHIICPFFYGPRDTGTYLLFFLLSRYLFSPVTGTTGHINSLWSVQDLTVLPVSLFLFSTCQLSPGQPEECCGSLPCGPLSGRVSVFRDTISVGLSETAA